MHEATATSPKGYSTDDMHEATAVMRQQLDVRQEACLERDGMLITQCWDRIH